MIVEQVEHDSTVQAVPGIKPQAAPPRQGMAMDEAVYSAMQKHSAFELWRELVANHPFDEITMKFPDRIAGSLPERYRCARKFMDTCHHTRTKSIPEEEHGMQQGDDF